MTVTTTVDEHLTIARRYEAEGRWSQAAEAYGAALASMPHPTSLLVSDDRAMLEELRRMAIHKSHAGGTMGATIVTEETKQAADEQVAGQTQSVAPADRKQPDAGKDTNDAGAR